MKTYILKYDVYNNTNFPAGTIVIITDDYWGKKDELNTGFTVMKGKLKGYQGSVANGLKEYLLDNTSENRNAFKEFQHEKKKIKADENSLNKRWNALLTAKI